MGDELRLPPRRPMPPEVRNRVRARVRAGVRGPNQARFGRAPFAVAAGVAVLAAGAMIVAQSVSGNTGTPGQRIVPPTGSSSTAARPLDVRKANAELDRCWAAIQAEGKQDRFPDRSRWRAVSTGNYLWVTVTAAFADNKPIFCQTSVTTVRVSEPTATPAYAAGSNTAALFLSPEGILAGIRDLSWAGVGVFTAGPGIGGPGVTSADLLPYGLFVDAARVRFTDTTEIEVDRWANDRDRAEHPERLKLEHPPAPVSRVDRPGPAKDRVSDRGKWLKECLDKAESPVVDADLWEPGAMVDVDGARFMVVRGGQEFAYCFTDATRWAFGHSMSGVDEMGKDRPRILPAPTALLTSAGERQFVSGALPDAATKLEIVQGNNQAVQADLWNNTFAALLPNLGDPSDVMRAYDDAGNKLYEGSLY